MTNIASFKTFVKQNPILTSYVNNGIMTWQKFYELYDLYGEENEVWSDYIKKEQNISQKTSKTTSNTRSISNFLDMAKSLDTNKIQEGITSIQKAISLFGDILLKDKTETSSTYTPRPIYRRFDD